MLKNEYPSQFRTILLLLMAPVAILCACQFDRWLSLETGLYEPVSRTAAAALIDSLEVDRDNRLATFNMSDGATIAVSFSARDRSDWPSGCPTNIGSSYMEVLDITVRPLVIGELSFEKPILVRDCSSDLERIALREDGLVGGGGSACSGLPICLTFTRQSKAVPVLTTPIVSARPLPSSMKGYELYSWYDETGKSWRYTLITGTNRLKKVEEIMAEGNQITQSEWVKMTATGTDELIALLERLPPGTELFWGGGDRLEGEHEATANITLPSSSVVEEIQNHCRQLEIQLRVSQ